VVCQCELAGLARRGLYYRARPDGGLNLELRRRIGEVYTDYPFLGSRRMAAWLRREGHAVNRKRMGRLMKRMGLEAIYPRPDTRRPNPAHKVYPYWLRRLEIACPDPVWSTDITYLRLEKGFVYRVAVIDWHRRKVLSWRLSNTLDTAFCLDCLEDALGQGTPGIFNTDQGGQFTSQAFTGRLEAAGIKISMDGRGRALDNVFVERLWRSVKYEEVYPKAYRTVSDAQRGLTRYFAFYNQERPHQGLDYATPSEVYDGQAKAKPRRFEMAE
jgi:putative transposase